MAALQEQFQAAQQTIAEQTQQIQLLLQNQQQVQQQQQQAQAQNEETRKLLQEVTQTFGTFRIEANARIETLQGVIAAAGQTSSGGKALVDNKGIWRADSFRVGNVKVPSLEFQIPEFRVQRFQECAAHHEPGGDSTSSNHGNLAQCELWTVRGST